MMHGGTIVDATIIEKAILLDVSERNVRTWIEWCGIRKDEIRDMINESRESMEKFSQIIEILEGIYEKEVAPSISTKKWRTSLRRYRVLGNVHLKGSQRFRQNRQDA